ncbi:hypothetical protein SK128_015489, partial [Halocaridina rubra]
DEKTIKVITFNPDGKQRSTTSMRLARDIQDSPSYTLCLRFNIWVFRLYNAMIYLQNIIDADINPISFETYFQKIRTKYGGFGKFYEMPINFAAEKWYHYCQTRDAATLQGRVYLDGQLLVEEPLIAIPDPATVKVIIGQDWNRVC